MALSDDARRRYELARAIAREAGDVTLEYFARGNFHVERKSDASPVTVADRRAEELLRRRIAAAFPDDAIIGEEWPERAGTSGFRWILDPIDGTKSFIAGVPLYSTLVGVEQGDETLIGVIHIPALAETVHAVRGGGAWHQRGEAEPVAARVSEKSRLADCLVCTSEFKTFVESGRPACFPELESACWFARTWGDGYGYLLLATGRADVMIDARMNVWDCAALAPVMEEAGGTFTSFRGERTIRAGEAVATNGHVLDEVLAITRRHPAV